MNPTTYEIRVEGLRLRAFHGVSEQERRVGNIFEVDMTLRYPFADAFRTDSVDDTLDYAEAVRIASRCMAVPSNLLEHVAGRIRDALLERFPAIQGGTIAVRKLTPPIAAQMRSVGVSISW